MTQTLSSPAETAAARPSVRVLTDRCAGCQECVIRCPTGTLSMDTVHWVAVAGSDGCVGCRQCERTCPFSAVVVDGPMLVEPRIEIAPSHPARLVGDVTEVRSGFAGWDEALAEAARCLQCPDPTCVRGCPAHNDIPGFVAAVRDRDLAAAHEILRRTTVLPDVCSRVCNQAAQCEGACSWSLAGGVPVAIGRLERFVADNAEVPAPTVAGFETELSVGIIGAGPAGAGAAWELVESGASVTVYEKDSAPGGVSRWGIPDFTLRESVALRPWRQLVGAGVELRCQTEIGPEELDGLLCLHDAVIVANGAGVPMRLTVPGADLGGVIEATTFLTGAKSALQPGGEPERFFSSIGLEHGTADRTPRVLVLGAGNTAMDVARTARRLGMAASCIDWVDERFALARPDELAEARDEGIEIRFTRTLTALDGSAGRVCTATLAATTQERADRPPTVQTGTTEALEVDLVVMAMGYRNDPAFTEVLPGTPVKKVSTGVPDRRWTASGILANLASSYANANPVGAMALGREVGLWSAALPVRERLWVVGDALTGPATVVEAMAQGRRAAAAVLDAGPARPARGEGARAGAARRVLVCYESAGGKTAQAAQAVADGLMSRGASVRVLPIAKVGAEQLAAADMVVVGTWVEGFVVAGVRPARAMGSWLAGLPQLGGRPVATFCTYGVAPRRALTLMRRALAAKGAVVVAQAAFGPKELAVPTGVFGPRAFGEQLARSTADAQVYARLE